MRKLPGKINGDMITKFFFPDKVGSEDDINCGDCMVWAYIAFKLYKGVELWDCQCHAFVKQDGKFFDSESPNGIKNYRGLKCNKRCPSTGYGRTNLRQFKKDWSDCEVNWNYWDYKIDDFWAEYNK